jgi:parallel beta-helix repeat protein
LNRAALTFDRNLDALVDPANPNAGPLPLAALRLRVGNDNSASNTNVTTMTPSADPGSQFGGAMDLGGGWMAGVGAKAAIISSEIKNTVAYTLDFPGSNDEQGNRDNRYQHHVTRTDSDGIEVIYYNFASQLGTENSSVQLNVITEIQKTMARQVVTLYEKYLGVRFVESDNQGFTIAVGDMQVINPATALTPVASNRPGDNITYAAGPLLANGSQSAVVIDSQEFNTADDNIFGSELFRSFMRGIGVLIGLGNADELPQSTVQNNTPITDPNVENVFPGEADIIHGKYIFRPEGKDIDLYKFVVPASGGSLSLQVMAERQNNSSLLDASLKLYRNEGSSSEPVWVQIAANEDYFSDDPRISLDFVKPGEYVVGVSAKGNTNYDPTIDDSGLGGRSEGKYDLRLDFAPPAASTLTDADGSPTPLDGDGDGVPGGVFNYWFVPTRPDRSATASSDTSAYTIWVDKTAVANGNGTLALPYNTIARAITEATSVAAADPTGQRAVTIRILGNSQSRAYEIGFNRLGQALADGTSFDVPRNVNVMIDAGAIIKMGRSRVSVGSSTVSVNRSGGTLQLLGTPDSKVIVTSIHDTTGIGVNPDRTPPAAAAGDWGGIDFRNRIDGSDETRTDKERAGLFLNALYHADVRFGGGQVIVDGVSQVITPINIIDSRPTIANSLVTRSADAAMSATPNSFREDDFRDPKSQAAGLFIPDYDRVGPNIYGNRVVNNTVNGLFVKTRTGAAQTLETITTSARFDDIDIPYVLGENLIVSGTAGGGILDVASPPTTVVTVRGGTSGSLTAGTYNYRLVYVDAAGNESLASIPTSSATVSNGGSISLGNLPPINNTLPYVGRRIYRSDANGGGTYRFVAQINAIATSFVDNGTVSGNALVELSAKIRPRLDGSLVVDPGAIIKNRGSRIEVRDSANMIAEGTVGLPVIMTSINDTRYGFGGTFDTAGNKGATAAAPGDWGGIFVGHSAEASMDFNRLSYAGGTTRIEGGFASFNAIEVHQADFRLANSLLELNESGTESNSADPDRLGRGTNDASALFVRGSQPVIVNNRIVDTNGAAISIDVNSLNVNKLDDYGRQTGELATSGEYLSNQGALVRGNRLSRNAINGMLVRGQELTTQSVFDDTDIVHVVQNTITSDNFHTYGGLQLKSDPNQSLVVKFGGGTSIAGLNATGTPLDHSNRVGGSIQILGQPGFPVILTAIGDDTVGAGFGVDGRPNFDTDNNGENTTSGEIILPTGPEVDRGLLIDNDVDINRPGFFSFEPNAGGEGDFFNLGGITAQGSTQLFVNENVIFAFNNYIDVGGDGGAIQLSATTITQPPTLVAPDVVISRGSFTGNNSAEVRWTVETRFKNGVAKLFNTLTLESDSPLGNIQFINYLDEDIQAPSDDFLYLTGTPGNPDFRAYTIDNRERIGFSHGGFYNPGVDLVNATYLGFAADEDSDLQLAIEGPGTTYNIAGNINQANLPAINDPVLGRVYGLANVTTALAWQTSATANTARMTSFLELVPTSIQVAASPGSWAGVSLQTYSNDRNVGASPERESSLASAPGANDIASKAQYLGQLAGSFNSGDENTRLGFEIQGVINKPSDVDVYSFTAFGGTEVWLDIDRTDMSLDTVVELISADGEILALSDDSYLEEVDSANNPLYSTLSGNSVHGLRKSSPNSYPQSSRGEPRDDYSTNPKDAGMRVVLPGQAGQASLYHVRVRSSNQVSQQTATSPALTNPASVGQGLSRGSYQLQVRLSEDQEFPGTSVNFADIRFAATGLDLRGVPRHSPLVGETAEINSGNNDTFVTAQELGNILTTDRRTISIAGNIASATDVDWFTFTIDYTQLITPLAEYLSTIFDLDYADGIGRGDLSMYLFAPTADGSSASLVRVGQNSNILDDRHAAVSQATNADLSRGSTGTLDPYIGPVELPAGRYYLAVTNRTQVPTVLANRLNNAIGASNLRIGPVSSGRFIVEDRVGVDSLKSTVPPVTQTFLDMESRIEYMLGDVPMYLSAQASNNGTSQTQFFIANAFTGELANDVGIAQDVARNDYVAKDTFIRPNGDIRAFRTGSSDIFDYMLVDSGDASTRVQGGFDFTLRRLTGAGELINDPPLFNVTLDTPASTVMPLNGSEAGFLVANRSKQAGQFGVKYFDNILYRFNPEDGSGVNDPAGPNEFNIPVANAPDIMLGAGTDITERGFIETNAAPGATSTAFAVTEATESLSNGIRALINDGDTVSLRLQTNTNVTIEFNSGPELFLNLDPVNAPSRVLRNGDQFLIDGLTYEITTGSTPVSTPNVRTVYYRPTMNNAEFAQALADAVPISIEVGFEGNRLNFLGALFGNFATLAARGVATETLANGNVGSGRVGVNFLANDTSETIAARVVQAINASGFPGLSAVAGGVRGDEVYIIGGTVQSTTGSSRRIGIAPGGVVQGIAGIDNTLYAVSDRGGLFSVSARELNSNVPGAIGGYVVSSHELIGINFTGLTAGPRHVDGGRYADLLFGTTNTGRIYAFDTQGILQPVFANGRTFVDTGRSGLHGVTFSNLDFNLWHQTQRRGANPGHGIDADIEGNTATSGSTSWYFGYERGEHDNVNFSSGTDPLALPRAFGEALENTYNFPGGASGVLESKIFSLENLTAADLPYLYFNYFLATEDFNSVTARDTFRVYAAGEDSSWTQLATNNSVESVVEPLSDNVPNPVAPNQLPGEVVSFPGTAWRQARVSLAQFAGQKEIRLRFEFSTAGGLGFNSFGSRGPELRTTSGSELRDGQTFTVGGKTFEIEMGPTLVFSSGVAIRNGETLKVRGSTFVFWDGTGTAPAGNVIIYSPEDSPSVIASKVLAALSSTTFVPKDISLNLTDPATRSEVFRTAIRSQVRPGELTRATGLGAIGDIDLQPGEIPDVVRADVDMVQIQLDAGTQLDIEVSASAVASGLNPRVRLFDALGNELARASTATLQDVNLSYTTTTAGTYYLGISNSSISEYNPFIAAGRTSSGTTGLYQLTVDVTPRTNFSAIGNRLQLDGNTDATVESGSSIRVDGAFGTSNSSNIATNILQTMSAEQVASAVSSVFESHLTSGADNYDTFRSSINAVDLTGVTVSDAGPFTVVGARPGDDFSEYSLGRLHPAYRSQNNNFEGLYIDDFVIGLAERGEAVTNAPADTSFTTVAGSGSSILIGPYQVEIRGGSEYGQPLNVGTAPPSNGGTNNGNVSTNSGILLNQAFDPNQALSDAVEVRFNPANQIADGETITVDDGVNSITFEFDDISIPAGQPGSGITAGNYPIPFDPVAGESAFVIAARFRDAINSTGVQSTLKTSALGVDGSFSGTNTRDLFLLGSSVTVSIGSTAGYVATRSPRVRFNGSSSISDGQSFTISDGFNTLRLEFNDTTIVAPNPGFGVQLGSVEIPYDSTVALSSVDVAALVISVINSTAVQSVLRVAAFPVSGLGGQPSDAILISGATGVSVPASIGSVLIKVLEGDRNTPREQGQVIIENSRISYSSGFGISITADVRDPVSGAPNPGAVRNTLTINNQRLIPGAVVYNNELIGNAAGGINLAGDTLNGPTDVPAAVPFARIVNNTILGGSVSRVESQPAISILGDFYADGALSFADVAPANLYNPRAGGGPVPIAGLQVPGNAVGAPDYTGVGEPLAGQGVVSLGRGGVLVVQFTDNFLTASDDARPDLAIYEVGIPELVRVEVSSDGLNYTSVGTASFNNRYIDLDQYGFNSLSQLQYVRLTDEPGEGPASGDSVGADIDAVGALSSRPGLRYGASGTGIRVGANASPTLLNNIVSNNATGISIAPTSTSTVIGGTLYQRNGVNATGATVGQFPIQVGATVPLFTDVVSGNLYPVPGSLAIDSSIDSLVDRAALLAVKQPLGLAPSPIIAPATDITGALRTDDPNVVAPPGLGESVFKDRGAADRSDFVGPSVLAISPRDNDTLGADSNPTPGVVELVSESLEYFDLQVLDTSALDFNAEGTGVDSSTVSRNSLIVTKNGRTLIEGRDYRFGFDSTSNIIRLTPLSGLWESGAAYQIRFINTNENLIQAIEPRSLIDGTTYTIIDAQMTSHYFEVETGILLRVPSSADNFSNTVIDGTIFRIDDGFNRVTFEFDSNDATGTGNIPIKFLSSDPPSILAQNVAAAVSAVNLQLTIKSIGNGQLQILGSNLIQFLPETSQMTASGKTGVTPIYGLQIPTNNGLPVGLFDGQTFSIQRGDRTLVFELDSNGTVRPNSIPVPLNTGSVDAQSALIVAAINASGLGLNSTFTAGGMIAVGTQTDLRIVTSGGLVVVGAPGRTITTPIVFDLEQVKAPSQVATIIGQVLTAANMPGVTNTVLGDQVFIEGSLGIGGLGTQVVSGIRDKAGNPMRATELNGDTLVTIFLGEGFDYGDAPDPNYASRRDNNGPRHKVAEGFSFGSTNTADPDARVPDEDIDDGLVFQSIVSGFTGSFQFSVQGVTLARPAYVGAWIDFNGNGAFDSSEKINIPGRIVNGLNTAVVFGVPADAVTDRPVAARFRLSSDQAAIGSPLGEAIDGEVEDWMVTIGKNPYTNPNNKYDVTGDGFVSPIDVLQIVNYINAGFPSRPTLPPAAVPPYLDVNGDGFINALDVLAVIDFINSNINGGTGSGEGEGSSLGNSWISARSVPQSAPSATPFGNGSTNSSAGSSMHFDRPDVRIAVGSNSSTDRTFANMFGEDSELAFDVIDLTSDELGSDKQTDSSAASADRELVSILGEVLDDLL